MSVTVTIRRTQRSDIEAIAELSRTEIEQGLTPRWTPARVAHILRQSDTNAYTLTCNDQLSGFTIASFERRRMHLVLHAVAPLIRRRGLGRQLLQWQIDAALVAGIVRATLEVRITNTDAQAFYESLSFEQYRLVPCYYSNREDAMCMHRSPLYQAS